MSVAKNIQYLQKLRSLLLLEYETEKDDFRLQSEKMPLARKIRRGICWHPVSVGRSYYNSLNQLVVEIYNGSEALDESDEDPDTAFEYGKPIQFFAIKADGKPAYFNWTSTISYVDGRRMVATVPSSGQVMQLQQTPDLGVQLYFDETSYKTMLHALDEVIGSQKGRLSDLRAVFSGDQEARKYAIPSVSMPWLNDSQQQAVHEVLRAKDVAVVHGPPGTGKTTTLVEAICETLHRETQVLVCAQSNTAVDWISEQLVDHGVSVLRVGNPSRVNDKMLSFTYERQFENHPDYPELWSIRKAIRQIRDSRQGSSDNRHQKLARLRERQAELEMRISHSLFAETRVVACTLVGAANKIMVGQKFSTLFIDEAAQALEPACWIAIRRAGRVILAGDHQQLPPTIKSYDAMQQGLGRTLMQRIVESQPDSVTLLTMQYRMNEAIMRFPSDWFYQGRLTSHPSVGHRSVIDYDQPIVWVESDEPEQFIGESHGRINKAEADLLLLHLEGYINKVGKERFLADRIDVGIISPYRVQTQYLRQQIHRRPFFKPFRNAITVQTVDGFQGQERDLILISLVRSNEHGQIGFLSDLRRMNVAMTRARMKLIIFGNSKTLSHYAFYRKLIEYIQSL